MEMKKILLGPERFLILLILLTNRRVFGNLNQPQYVNVFFACLRVGFSRH